MERKGFFILLIAAYISFASPECLDGNCTSNDADQPATVLRVNFNSFPFFSPVDINVDNGRFVDDAIDPRLLVKNDEDTSDVPDDINGFMDDAVDPQHLVKNEDDTSDMSSADSSDPRNFVSMMEMIITSSEYKPQEPNLNIIGLILGTNRNIDETLDFSGSTMEGISLKKKLFLQMMLGQPVSSLVLSNARIQDLSELSLQPVQDILVKLSMDNSSVNLETLVNLSNLQFLNLSNNGLTTFQWYPKLTETLQVLDLSHNNLQEVRPELSILSNLRELYLSHNKIMSVKEFPLTLLPNLEIVSLTMNSLTEAKFTELINLQQLDVDWNYLRRVGYELELPAHSVSLKLASNPWRCDCALLDARDNNLVLDINILKCANDLSFSACEGCERYFLPLQDGRSVLNETKDSIHYLGCTGISDQFYLLQGAIVKLRDNKPEKLYAFGMIVLGSIILSVMGVISCRTSYLKKKFDRKSWLKIQQPYLKIDHLTKAREVPYVKI